MVAHCDSNGIFEVDLCQQVKGFILDLTHEYDYEQDPERREALVPALSRNERDHFLDACYSLFSVCLLAGERDNLCGHQQRKASCQNESHSPYQVQIHPRPS